jgi:O-antigen/teichoic acid export membrane protein
VAVLHAQGDWQGLRDTYLRSARVACFLAGWLGGLLITLGPAFLSTWVAPDYGTPVVLVVAFLALGLFAQVLTSQVPLAFYQALECLRFPAAVLMGEALMNLGMSVVLVRSYGLTGVAFSTLIPGILSLTILPSYLCRQLGLPVLTFFKAAIAPGISMLVLTVLLQFALGVTHAGESYFALIARVLTTVPLAIGLIAWTFPVDDPIRKFIQRRPTGPMPFE